MKRIILFTRQYPFGHHETFLGMELSYLAKEFDEILIFPNLSGSNSRKVPENVVIDTSMSLRKMGRLRYLITAVFSTSPALLFQEIISNIKFIIYPRALWRSLSYLEEASRVQNYLEGLNEKGDLNPGKTIFYTYWLRGQALGVSLFKRKFPDLIFVSRAHGGDLYEERNDPPYLPFKVEILQNINSVYPISQHGYEYLERKYKGIEFPAKVANLGVEAPGFTAIGSSDGVLRIVSCSTMKKVKRLDLLILGLSELVRLFPDIKIEWNHLGSGPLHGYLSKLANEKLIGDIRWSFHGQLSQEQVIEFYKFNPVDIFINVSSSEGIPVSIMEAQSCGIPVIATAVGGTPEIVNDQNGRLLDSNPSPAEVAHSIEVIMTEITEKKKKSRKDWEDKFNANENYSSFGFELRSLLD